MQRAAEANKDPEEELPPEMQHGSGFSLAGRVSLSLLALCCGCFMHLALWVMSTHLVISCQQSCTLHKIRCKRADYASVHHSMLPVVHRTQCCVGWSNDEMCITNILIWHATGSAMLSVLVPSVLC